MMRNDKTVCGNRVAAVFVAGVALLAGTASAQAGLVAYWDFNETSGTVLNDVVGSSNGALYEGTAVNTAGPLWVAGRAGAGNALSFNNPIVGDVDLVGVTDSPAGALDFGTGAMTYSGWFRNDGVGDQGAFLLNHGKHNVSGIVTSLSKTVGGIPNGNTGKLVIDIKGTGGDNIFVRSNLNLSDGNWHWYAMVAQGGTGGSVNLYVDGLLQNSTATYGAGTSANLEQPKMYIGALNTGGYGPFAGEQDDIAFFDTALTGTLDQVGNLTGGDLFTLWQNGPTAVPEPASLALLGFGGLMMLRRRTA